MAKTKKTDETPVEAPDFNVYQLKITLKDFKPAITRTVQVPEDYDFDELHYVIQIAMGWENCHMYMFKTPGRNGVSITSFEFNEEGYAEYDAEDTAMSEVLDKPKAKIKYTYDMGDSWEHEVVLEKILPAQPNTHYPLCINGAGACPPEDCGGVWGYAQMLETIEDPKAEDYADMREWLGLEEGEKYDPTLFDIEEVNAHFKATFKPHKKKKTSKKTSKAKEPKKPIMINFSATPWEQWDAAQKEDTWVNCSKIIDLVMPQIPASADTGEIIALGDKYMPKILKLVKKGEEAVVHIVGDPILVYYVVGVLSENDNLYFLSSVFEEEKQQDANGKEITVQRFVRFRSFMRLTSEMPNPEDLLGMLSQMMGQMGGNDDDDDDNNNGGGKSPLKIVN